MRRIITLTQEKMVKIYSPEDVIMGHGFSDVIKGEIYFEVLYQSDKQVAELEKKAQIIYQEKYEKSWVSKPKVEIYWKTVSEEIVELTNNNSCDIIK